VEPTGLRAHFPVLARVAYLNAGTDGPLAARAVTAAQAELERELAEGRTSSHFQRRGELADALRGAYARALRCEPADVSLTTSTTEGIAQVVTGMALAPGDEILTSDEEHPGLQGALAAARDIMRVSIREVPFARLAEEIEPATRLVACSHVSWATGAFAPAELAEVDVPVLFDGAQGLGAVDVDVTALGCDAYAGSGQKWMCGPDGSGALWVAPGFREQLVVPRRGYGNLAEANEGLAAQLHDDGRRFDAPSLSAEALACSLAAAEVLEEFGWEAVWERAAGLAARLVEMLGERGRVTVPRGASTLVSFHSDDPEGEREALAEEGVALRNLPGRPWLRASVGAWNDESDLERLVGSLAR
jgi:selenocysteine lyase/cysteine desulfurase